jgi:hypothetical protein
LFTLYKFWYCLTACIEAYSSHILRCSTSPSLRSHVSPHLRIANTHLQTFNTSDHFRFRTSISAYTPFVPFQSQCLPLIHARPFTQIPHPCSFPTKISISSSTPFEVAGKSCTQNPLITSFAPLSRFHFATLPSSYLPTTNRPTLPAPTVQGPSQRACSTAVR